MMGPWLALLQLIVDEWHPTPDENGSSCGDLVDALIDEELVGSL